MPSSLFFLHALSFLTENQGSGPVKSINSVLPLKESFLTHWVLSEWSIYSTKIALILIMDSFWLEVKSYEKVF